MNKIFKKIAMSCIVFSHVLLQSHTYNQLIYKLLPIQDTTFECYPNFATTDIFVRCHWAESPCLVQFDIIDTEEQYRYKIQKSVANGTQTIKLNISSLKPGPYYIKVSSAQWIGTAGQGFVKVEVE